MYSSNFGSRAVHRVQKHVQRHVHTVYILALNGNVFTFKSPMISKDRKVRSRISGEQLQREQRESRES